MPFASMPAPSARLNCASTERMEPQTRLSIDDCKARLQQRRNHRNSFAPYLYGQFNAADGGTRVEDEFRLHPFAQIFMALWFSFLAVFAISVLVLPSQGQADSARWLARNEEGAILALLKSSLEASDAA